MQTMIIRLTILLLCCLVVEASAEEIGVTKSNLVFPLPTKLIAELGYVQLRLMPRFEDDSKRFGGPVYQNAYVASIIGKGDKKYILVGFPVKGNRDSAYTVIMQYCDKIPSYEIAEGGLTSGSLDRWYQDFINANNMELIQLDDICSRLYMGDE